MKKHISDKGFVALVVFLVDVALGMSNVGALVALMLPSPHDGEGIMVRGASINAPEVLAFSVAAMVWFTLRARHEAEGARMTVNCGSDCSERYLEGYRKSIAALLLNIGVLIAAMAFKVLAK